MKLNKTFLIIAAFILCLAATNTTKAQSIIDQGITGALTWVLTDDDVLTISGSGAMPDYNWSTMPWYSHRVSITFVVIEDDVTTVGNDAFFDFRWLTSVTIGNSVKTIGEYAFADCSKLTSVTIPNDVTNIGDYAFANCSGLASITSSAITPPVLGNDVFTSVDTDIPVYVPCFTYDNYSIASGWSVFSNFIINGHIDTTYQKEFLCAGVSYTDDNFIIPITSIGTYYTTLTNATGCDSVICLTLTESPNGTTGDLTWSLCNGVLTISGNGAMENYIFSGTPWYSYNASITSVIIEEGVTTIGNLAFLWYYSLETITIPNSVTTIGVSAFEGCRKLTSVTIGNSVTRIEDLAFVDCKGLKSITIHAITPPALEGNAFYNVPTHIPVYIPCQGYRNYTNHTKWGRFTNIIGSTDTMFYTAAKCDGILYTDDNFTSLNLAGTHYATLKNTTGCDSVICLTLTKSPSGTTGDLTWSLCDSTLTISGSGTMEDYPFLGSPWYPFRYSITTVIIGNSVTSIGNNAFRECRIVTSVTIPNSVTTIGNAAFSSCFALTSVTIPNSVTSIDNWAFADCYRLTTVNFNADSCINVGPNYWERSPITTVNIGNNVKKIPDNAFARCRSITSITIPNSVTSIGNAAFGDCRGLTSITSHAITPPVSGNDAFDNVSTDIPVHIPCFSYNNYSVAPVWSGFSDFVVNGSVDTTYYADTICAGAPYTDDNFTTPINSVGTYYKRLNGTNCDSVVCLTLEYFSNKTIGELIWSLCDGTLTISGNGAMPDCTLDTSPWYSRRESITSIIIGDGVTSIGDFAFFECSKLTSVTIGNSVKTIGEAAFADCYSLTSITIPNSVTTIGDMAFYYCDRLTSITTHAITPPALGIDVFILLSTDIPVYVPCQGYSDYANPKWGGFTNIIGSTDTMFYTVFMCDDTPYTDDNFTGLNLAGTYYRVLENTTGCDSVVCLTFTESPSGTAGDLTWSLCDSILTISGNGAMPDYTLDPSPWYSHRESIASVIIGNSVTSIGERAFLSCSELTSVTIGNSVQTIGVYAFFDCSKLTSVTIPNDVTSIGDWTFFNCNKLTSVTIPNSVTSIGNYAFANCSGLASITSHAITPPALGLQVFWNVLTTIPVYVPCQGYSYYTNPAKWGGFTNIIGRTDTMFYTAFECEGILYMDDNFTGLNLAGTYYRALKNTIGCDSVVCLILGLYPSVAITNYSATICEGATYTDDYFTDLTQAGLYRDTLQNINGCDSIIVFTLDVYPSVAITNYSATICEGTTYTDDNFTDLTEAGTYRDTLQNVNGCDSIIELKLTVNPLPKKPVISKNENVIESTFANSYQWYFNGVLINGATQQTYTYTQYGTYFVEVANEHGCVSKSDDMTVTGVGIVETQSLAPSVQIYPNPAQHTLYIQSSEAVEQVSVYDINGRMLNNIVIARSADKERGSTTWHPSYEVREHRPTGDNPPTNIDISTLANGIYLVKVRTTVGETVKKIVISD